MQSPGLGRSWGLIFNFRPDGSVQPGRGCTVPAGVPLCGDYRDGLPFSVRSGENATGKTDGFLWRGCVIIQARRTVSRFWGRHFPTNSRPGGRNERKQNLGHGSIFAIAYCSHDICLSKCVFRPNALPKTPEPIFSSCRKSRMP